MNKAPKAAVQIVHGMAEYGERYEPFARWLCEAGFDVWCMDLPGHGRSIGTKDDLGFFGEKHGWEHVVTDIRQMYNLMREKYPEQFPIFLFGHSMGSFLARAYCERFSEDLAGAVFCGTSAPNPAATAGVLMAKLTAAFQGERCRSQLLDTLAFGHYNDKIEKPRTKFDWLNTDDESVEQYIDDPLCGFCFTANGFIDLFSLLKSISGKQWFTSIPYQFPILFLAGEADPVGSYGKGVELVARRLREAGCNRTTTTIFPGMRHEILNEPGRQMVYEAVVEWMEKILGTEN
jgi:alpha-beta hydrolase superfamily lysophospholipase